MKRRRRREADEMKSIARMAHRRDPKVVSRRERALSRGERWKCRGRGPMRPRSQGGFVFPVCSAYN